MGNGNGHGAGHRGHGDDEDRRPPGTRIERETIGNRTVGETVAAPRPGFGYTAAAGRRRRSVDRGQHRDVLDGVGRRLSRSQTVSRTRFDRYLNVELCSNANIFFFFYNYIFLPI